MAYIAVQSPAESSDQQTARDQYRQDHAGVDTEDLVG